MPYLWQELVIPEFIRCLNTYWLGSLPKIQILSMQYLWQFEGFMAKFAVLRTLP